VPFAFMAVKGEPDDALGEFHTHRDEGRPVTCGVHDTSFSEQFALKTHKPTHSGERPFSCDVCHKTFNRQFNLTVHNIYVVGSGHIPVTCVISHSFRRVT
jgi:KRAB domain-containing zinc finger protein